jgi:ABC-2 type transport system permease protein
MIKLIRAEFQKILTVRSTYFILLFCLAILIFFAFYVEAIRLVADVKDPGKLQSEVLGAIGILPMILSFVAALAITHEYRFNTIMYLLVASRSRLKAFLAKVFAISVFAVLAILFFASLSPLLTSLGLQIKGLDMVTQNIPYLDLLWRGAFVGWAFAMFALILAFIIRNQAGVIVSILLIPSTVEQLLGLLLKENTKYLPYTALNNIINTGPAAADMSHGKSALIALAYIAVGLIVAALLFKKRDAN